MQEQKKWIPEEISGAMGFALSSSVTTSAADGR